MNRRSFLKNAGLAGLGLGATTAATQAFSTDGANDDIYLPVVANKGYFLNSTFLIAASDAPSSVKATAQYLCTGNNDQVVINQVINELGPTGGNIQLSEGTFFCTGAVRLNPNTTLLGKGRATILKAESSWAAFDGTPQGALIEPAQSDTDRTFVGFLAINGNRFEGPDVKGIYFNITSNAGFSEGPDAAHYFTDIYIYETERHAFHLTGSRMRGNQITRVRIYNPGDEGHTVSHGFYIDCPDSFYSQCECGASTGSGFYIEGANNRFTNCKSWFSELSGWQILAPRNQFAACEAQDNQQHGFYITTGPNSFTACHADSNSWNQLSPTASYDGFHIPWGSRIQLMGCAGYDKNESNRGTWQRYGFFLGPAAQHCQVVGTADSNRNGGVSGAGATNAINWVIVSGQ